ncbi:MAG: YqjK family protein [Nitrosomonadaceae bacterium]|nr:YqjK family protein [Nitrosomonadaceae bacterium]
MSASLDDIRWRRTQLVARAAVQRGEVTAVLQRLAEPLRMVDTAVACLRYLKAHPLVPVAALVSMGVAFMLSRNYSIFRLLQLVLFRAFALWRTYRSLSVWIARGRAVWLRIGTTWRNSRRNNLSSTR